MNKIYLDNREVKVGDRLWCFCAGWSTVSSFNDDYAYPLLVNGDDGILRSYSVDGKLLTSGLRSLFWNEIKFEIPEPPKEVENYYQVMFCERGESLYRITENRYRSVDEFLQGPGRGKFYRDVFLSISSCIKA